MGVTTELAAVATASFAIGFSGALSPGPLTVFTIREAARHGMRAGPLATLGHGVLELTLVVGLAFGLSHLLDEESIAAASIAVAGGLALVVMGVKLLRSAPSEALLIADMPHHETDPTKSRFGYLAATRIVLGGVVTTIANPYWFIWWATVGAVLTAESLAAGAAGPVAFFAGHILSDLAWLTLVASFVSSGRQRLGTRGYRALLTGCGAFLFALGFVFLGVGGFALA